MPLRDHFRSPLDNLPPWDDLYGQWPGTIVQQLRKVLPPGYVAGPRVHAGSQVEMDYDEYEVRIYDARQSRRLVAAIEIVSPANKDRPDSRNAFIAKCAALLQRGIAVSIVDLVAMRHLNLYADLLAFIGHDDKTLGAEPPPVYAVSTRCVQKEERAILETWSYELEVGQPLPVGGHLPRARPSSVSIAARTSGGMPQGRCLR